VSTQVYRVRRGSETFYLRIAEEADENLETDAELHERLRAAGVRVAGVVHVEPFDAGIGRSIMITTEVPGVPLTGTMTPSVAASVVADAGADLAVLNQVPVDGFGWVRRRGRGWPPRAEHVTYRAFAGSEFPHPWPGPLASVFATAVLDTIEAQIERERSRPLARAVLAHGDFDVSPIFCLDGRYTGLIDLGEIRGTEPLFDLGHFHLHDGETIPVPLLPALLDGYQRVHRLPADHEPAIHASAILLGLRQLCRWLRPPRRFPVTHPAVTRRARRISHLAA
jgi:aminoglycoside phosphotransferase (APT) family kinase protein